MNIFFNNFINFIIEFVFNKLIYDFRVNNNINLLENLLSQNFKKLRFIKREIIDEIIIKARYNDKYTLFNFKKNNEIYLRLYHNYKISKKET